jgi:hypothetical protein
MLPITTPRRRLRVGSGGGTAADGGTHATGAPSGAVVIGSGCVGGHGGGGQVEEGSGPAGTPIGVSVS